MFNNVKTSKANRELVTQLTHRLNLGAENVIGRLAISFSLARDRKIDITRLQDAQGKEYTAKTLLGPYVDIYIAIVCTSYNIHKSDKDLGKYIKGHLDDGLLLINQEISKKGSITGNDFIINEVEKGLSTLLFQ